MTEMLIYTGPPTRTFTNGRAYTVTFRMFDHCIYAWVDNEVLRYQSLKEFMQDWNVAYSSFGLEDE